MTETTKEKDAKKELDDINDNLRKIRENQDNSSLVDYTSEGDLATVELKYTDDK